jgi:hypothetical protein
MAAILPLGGMGHWQFATLPFPIRVELETLTMCRGSISVSNSRAIGNSAVAEPSA